MKNYKIVLFILSLSFLFILESCNNDIVTPTQNNQTDNIDRSQNGQVNLVSDTSSYNPRRIDMNLVNAWGIAISPSGHFWISANHTSVATIYDGNGNNEMPPVTIPGSGGPGAPTGVIYNPTNDFKISGIPVKFIFAGEDGIISAWTSGSAAVIAANRSAHNSVYKGLAMGELNHAHYIYAADFHNSKIDVFDTHFNYKPNIHLQDPGIPAGWGPFNIYSLDDKLIVSYAKQKPPENVDDDPGPGHGFIDIYRTDGTLVRRFASHGALNSPWGIAVSSEESDNDGGNILIGNFGDGSINMYDRNGSFRGPVKDNHGQPVTIEGLWAITFIRDNDSDHGKLYFTAGPDGEDHGLFGFLRLRTH